MIGVPAGMQPRAAVLYGTIGALECAAVCGAAPALHAEIDMSTALLEQLVEEWGRDAADDVLPKRIARELGGGSQSFTAPARPWRSRAAGAPS